MTVCCPIYTVYMVMGPGMSYTMFFLTFTLFRLRDLICLKQKTYNFNAKNSHTLYLGKFIKIGKKVEKNRGFTVYV